MVKELSHIFCSIWQLQNKTLQKIKTIKTQTVNSNYSTPDDDQKYGWKYLGRRYGTIPLPPESQHKKNNKKTWKIMIKINKQCFIIFNKNLP